MNYTTFLKKVDSAAAACEIENIRGFVHEIARSLPEERRDRFLSVLESFSNPLKRGRTIENKKDSTLSELINEALEKIKEIQDGERSIECEYNEEWDDWDGEWQDEFNFSDPEDVLDDIEEAISLIHKSIDRGEYVKGAELAKRLSELEVHVNGPYYDPAMNIMDMIMHNLIDVESRTLLRESVYIEYLGNEESCRAEAMVRVMDNYKSYSITLEDILENAEEEIDTSSLLPDWIEELAKRPAGAVDKLLEEALGMLDDMEEILNIASRYAQVHPELYLSVMRSGTGDSSEMLDIGLKAMNEVSLESDKRSEICLLTAGYAVKSGEREKARNCWVEAFLSTPGVVNYLRIRLLCENWEAYRERMHLSAEACYRRKSSWDCKPYAALLFFENRYDVMIEKYMNAGEGLGWSGTFMKEGIALLLMLLSDEKGGRGMAEMRKTAFDAVSFKADEYSLGTDIKCSGSDYDTFIDCFEKWKKGVSIDDEQCERLINEIEKWIELRVGAIMNANKRKYYGECASFIAALGETMESRGQKGAKESLMSGFRTLYPRRHAFIAELVSYGMTK